MTREEVLASCLKIFEDEADYVKCLNLLSTSDHFFARDLEGWIHSLLFDFAKAKLCYDVGLRLADEQLFTGHVGLTIMDIPRYVFLHTQIFESALMEKHPDPATRFVEIKFKDDSPNFWKRLNDKNAESFGHSFANAINRYLEACLLLHLGYPSLSLAKYNEVLPVASANVFTSQLGKIYFGKALACYNLGNRVEEFEKSLEDAVMAVHTTRGISRQMSRAARFYAIFSFLGRKKEAQEWREFLVSFKCPDLTKEIYLKLSQRILARCNQLDRAVFF